MTPMFGVATSLPNLHPLVLHFPIALAMFALALRVAHMIWPRWQQADYAAGLVTAGAALGGIAAWLAGRQAVTTLGPLSAPAELTLSRHANLAGWTAAILILAAVLAGVAAKRRHSLAENQRIVWRAGLFLSLVVVAGLLAVTADLGGRLVYVHGVAVAPLSRAPAGANAAENGGGVTLTTATSTREVEIGPDGALLEVSGEGLVTLAGVYDDVTVTAVLDPSGFTGTIALVHHASSLRDWEGLAMTPDGVVSLVRWTAGQSTVLKKTSLLFPREEVQLDVAAAQGHFKGFVDEELLVHGHGASGAPGWVGLYFKGDGVLHLTKLQAQRAAPPASAGQEHHSEHGE